MKKLITSSFFILGLISTYAQESKEEEENKKTRFNKIMDNLSGSFESNAQWYNDDKKEGPFIENIAGKDLTGEEHLRANSYLRLDYNFLKNFTVGIQAESYAPMSLLNYSPSFDQNIGLAQYYANFKNEKLDITAGYFYEQYGSGLLLRAWEDRALGLNNSLRGGRIQYNPTNSITLSGFWGQQRVGFDVADSQLFGTNVEFDLASLLKTEKLNTFNIGFSYLGKYEEYESNNPNDVPELVNSFSGRIDLDFGKVYTNFEYVHKGADVRLNDLDQVVEEKTFDGSAILWTLGYSQKGFGISNTFRRLEGMGFYSNRTAFGNLFGEQVINYIPGLTKQHDYTLANIAVYQAQPGLVFDVNRLNAGEIGNQIDIFYKIKKGTKLGGKYGTKLSFNLSYWAGLNTEVTDPNPGVGGIFSNEADYEADFLNFKNKYFRDLNIEIRKKWSPKFSSIFSYVNINGDKSLITSGIPTGQKSLKTDIAIAESTLKLSKGKSARLELQHLWTNDELVTTPSSHKGNWLGFTSEFNFSSKLGIYINDSYNYGNDDSDRKVHYYNVGGSYTKGATRIGLNYGRQRGGLLCVGGVCRMVSPNTGLTLNIATSF